MRSFLLLSVLFFTALGLRAQDTVVVEKDTTFKKADTIRKRPVYVNQGKIAGRRAAFRSMLVPGLGQIGNGLTVYRFAKVAGIYVGGTMLTLSYIENSRNYRLVLEELKFRAGSGGIPDPNGPFRGVQQIEGLNSAKDTFKRNTEIIIFSYIGLYLVNIIEAYIDARLKYFDVSDIAFKVSPGMIDTHAMYGFNQGVPGIKLTLKF